MKKNPIKFEKKNSGKKSKQHKFRDRKKSAILLILALSGSGTQSCNRKVAITIEETEKR